MSVTNIANENEIRALTLDEIEHVSGAGIKVCTDTDGFDSKCIVIVK